MERGRGRGEGPEKTRFSKRAPPPKKHTTHLGQEIGFTPRSGEEVGVGVGSAAGVTPQSARVRVAAALQGSLTFSINSQLPLLQRKHGRRRHR